jgi:pyruvate dehydrogenase E1 component alpha subunit
MTKEMKEQNAAALAGHNGFSLISNDKLLQFYSTMVQCRLIAERAQANRQGSLAGQEAVATGVLLDLLPEDAIACDSNNRILRYIHGTPLNRLFARATEPAFALQLRQVLGAVQAGKTEVSRSVAAVFAASDSRIWREALTQAHAEDLPILFICPVRPAAEPVHRKLETAGLARIIVDGNDVVAVYRVATEAITHARKGNGPTLIECIFNRTKAHDPVSKMEAYLTGKDLFRAEWKRKVESNFKRRLDAALKAGSKLQNS